ncbi:O-Glycosyl hydrolases family 17 protein [Actinidia rufa]|uniref:O-Glycosyl hydrolases family 17 protein n=1 Tax=Actinidia rufa TaxID=165716 RepID=A0A7J0HG20_9ERIC|nr:O-Glycosyl hydrolases family 17 protein [Actinidia rufa]
MATPNLFHSLFFPIIFFLYYFPIASLSDPGLIGVNYGPALSGSGISVTVALPNDLLPAASTSQYFTDTWVQSNIAAYTPATKIQAIAVGNEVFADPTQFLVPAMNNVYSSLVKFNLDKSIKVSSPVALTALAVSYPASSGSFRPELIEPVIKPMLNFLRRTGSYLMMNVYPFFAYMGNTAQISLDYALFRDKQGVVDSGNGLRYYNLFDVQIDAVFAAMNALQFEDVKLVITETGWPSIGDDKRSRSERGQCGGVQRQPGAQSAHRRPGPTSERNYGLFYPNEDKVYNIPLTLEDLNTGESKPVNETKTTVLPVHGTKTKVPDNSGNVSTAVAGRTWCVANGKVGEEKLQAALDYACSTGGVDCRSIQEGATCYDPNTLEAHASYAFNSYYQMNARGSGTCDFGGAAYVVTQPPSAYSSLSNSQTQFMTQ